MSATWKTPAGRDAVRERYRAFLQHWPVENRQFVVPTRHGETFVVACGQEGAPPVVLLHGSGSNAIVWGPEAAALAPRYRIYAIDMIGEAGLSDEGRPSLASGAYLEWMDDVFSALDLERAALVGVSLGGWMALDYATRRPERASALALLCPGGVGKHRNVLLWAAPLMLLGPWGRRTVTRIISGRRPDAGEPSPVARAFGDFLQLVYAHFRPRSERLPRFGDAALRRLTMPVFCVLGGRDAMIDSPGTRARLAANVPHAEIRYLDDAGHFLTGQTAHIADFLDRALRP